MPLVTLPIDELVRELERLPADEFNAGATELVRLHPIEWRSLEPYAFFSERHYTRNLIFKSDVFELLALCWWPGQQSSIHNHRDQRCWMMMGCGSLENINFKVHDKDPARGTCRLEETFRVDVTRDAPLGVDPEEPVHLIRNVEERQEKALSVHLYSRPFDSCEVYSPDQGTYKDVKLTYWSTYGQPCGPG